MNDQRVIIIVIACVMFMIAAFMYMQGMGTMASAVIAAILALIVYNFFIKK